MVGGGHSRRGRPASMWASRPAERPRLRDRGWRPAPAPQPDREAVRAESGSSAANPMDRKGLGGTARREYRTGGEPRSNRRHQRVTTAHAPARAVTGSAAEADLVEEEGPEGAGVLAGEHANVDVVIVAFPSPAGRGSIWTLPDAGVPFIVARPPHDQVARGSPPSTEVDAVVVPAGVVGGEEAAAGELEAANSSRSSRRHRWPSRRQRRCDRGRRPGGLAPGAVPSLKSNIWKAPAPGALLMVRPCGSMKNEPVGAWFSLEETPCGPCHDQGR